MRRIMLWLIPWALVAFLSLSAQAAEEHLPIVFEDYPPYEFVHDGEVGGINLEIIREAFSRMGVKPYFEPRPWKRALLQLQQGEILALSSGFKNRERQAFAYFPAPLAMETNCIFTYRGSGLAVRSLEGIRGHTLGVVSSYDYGPDFAALRGLDTVETKTSHQLLRMLLNRRVPLVIGNKAVFRYLAKEQGKLDELVLLFEVGSEPLYLMFSKAHGERSRRLAEAFGKAVRAMREDGTFAAIEAKY